MLPKIATSASDENKRPDSLATLASLINAQHDQATRHARSALEHARQAGELLQQAKAQVGHGGWVAWLATNCDVSPRQAQRYMKVANNWEAISKNDAASHLTIDEAIQENKLSDCPIEARLHSLRLVRSVIDELSQKLASADDIDEIVEIQKQATECHLLAAQIRFDFERAAGRLLNAAGRIGGGE